jgi:hypothetical protein
MASKHHPTLLSGGDRKALTKELSKARAMTRILAIRSEEKRQEGIALIREADDLLCQSWNEKMWSDGCQWIRHRHWIRPSTAVTHGSKSSAPMQDAAQRSMYTAAPADDLRWRIETKALETWCGLPRRHRGRTRPATNRQDALGVRAGVHGWKHLRSDDQVVIIRSSCPIVDTNNQVVSATCKTSSPSRRTAPLRRACSRAVSVAPSLHREAK